MQLKCICR